MTDRPDPGPNHDLPTLSPLRARSTVAALLSLAALVGPLVGGGIGEVLAELAANRDLIQAQTERVVEGFNAILGVAALVWFWWERRAPHFRLSFRRR
jgi:MFS family permease